MPADAPVAASQTAPPLTRLDVLRGLRISTWEGVWATAWTVLTGGAFQIGFALQLGATPFVLGLLAGLPAIVGLLQLPASIYSEKLPSRRRFIAVSSGTGRALWLLIACLPFVLPAAGALWAFLLFLTVSSALLTIVVPAWTSWMSDLVPASSRGQYFARRNTLAGLVTMILPLPAAAFLDLAVKRDLFAPRLAFAVLFVLGVCAAVGSFVMLTKQPEPPRAIHQTEDGGDQSKARGLRALLEPLSDTNFRPFLWFAAAMVCGQTLAGQFFTAWQVDKAALNLPYFLVQVLGAVASGASLLSTPIWGYLNDKYGARPLLAIASVGVIVAPLIWLLTVPSPRALWANVALIVLINIFSGVSWGGVGLAQFNLLLANSPDRARSTYVAMFSAATGVLGGLSPVVGGLLMTRLEGLQFALGPIVFNNYKILFLLTALVRVGCVFLLKRVPSGSDGRSTRYVLEQLRNARKPVTSFLTMRRLTRPNDAETRLEAVEDLADLRTPLAVEELAYALNDVSLPVREGAARALGATGDIRAVPYLIEKLNDPAAQIGELCAEALGQIGSRDATPALMAAGSGPDAGVRVAAFKALARIADPNALSVIILALDTLHPTTCEAACSALAALAPQLGPNEAQAALPRLGYLLSQEVDRGMRLASARTLARLAGVGAREADARVVWKTLSGRVESEPDPSVAAQEAVALQAWASASGKTAPVVAAQILPILNRADMHGLAYKQTLEAVADAGLPDGTFYPYLSLAPENYDETLHRMVGEINRRAGSPNGQAVPATVLETFGTGDYASALHLLVESVESTGRDTASATPARTVLFALEQSKRASSVRPEEVLLAALLLRDSAAV